jgi:hypothetical protein
MLMMKAIYSFETPGDLEAARGCNPEDRTIHSQRCGNLKCKVGRSAVEMLWMANRINLRVCLESYSDKGAAI